MTCADAFAKSWTVMEQVRPLYFRCTLRPLEAAREVRGGRGAGEWPIPAHLLGNMWAQEWENIYPLVRPRADPATTSPRF